MKYQVTAQSTDTVVITFDAKDMFDAAEVAGNKFGADIYVKSANQGAPCTHGTCTDGKTLSVAVCKAATMRTFD